MKKLTVITTTYNRAYCLHQVYESLCKQDNKEFIWLVIDDGSNDNTKELVSSWKEEKKIEIEYFYKKNGGMHTARNEAYRRVHTELNVIIDSDDWMAVGAVDKILKFWADNKSDEIAGIFSLDATPQGETVGTDMPKNVRCCHYEEFWDKYKMSGDKKLIYRSDLTKQFPYPEFEGEKFFPPSYKFLMLDQKYKMLIMDEVTCIVDYNEDSMTRDKYAQYRNSAKGFAYYRNEISKLSTNPKTIIRQMIHYVAESKLSGEKHYISKAHKKGYALLCYIPGQLLYQYLLRTKRKW